MNYLVENVEIIALAGIFGKLGNVLIKTLSKIQKKNSVNIVRDCGMLWSFLVSGLFLKIIDISKKNLKGQQVIP